MTGLVPQRKNNIAPSGNISTNSNFRKNVVRAKRYIKQYWGLYFLFLPSLLYVLIFLYGPMYGVTIAFKNFNSTLGIWGSPWVGLIHFERFLKVYSFWVLLRNTLTLSVYALVAGFPIPILFALLLNQLNNLKFKKLVQTVSYAPHFISIVVLVGMLPMLFSQSSGIINIILKLLGGQSINFLGSASFFKHIYVWSGIWQSIGWSSIIYIAALANVSPELHEAAVVDGANKLQRIWHVDIPSILPTAVTMLILSTGNIMSVGFEKAFLMQNSLNIQSSEIISTYVYKIGLLGAQFSFSTAVGLFNGVVSCLLVFTVNYISKRLSETSLW